MAGNLAPAFEVPRSHLQCIPTHTCPDAYQDDACPDDDADYCPHLRPLCLHALANARTGGGDGGYTEYYLDVEAACSAPQGR